MALTVDQDELLDRVAKYEQRGVDEEEAKRRAVEEALDN